MPLGGPEGVFEQAFTPRRTNFMWNLVKYYDSAWMVNNSITLYCVVRQVAIRLIFSTRAIAIKQYTGLKSSSDAWRVELVDVLHDVCRGIVAFHFIIISIMNNPIWDHETLHAVFHKPSQAICWKGSMNFVRWYSCGY